MDDTILKIPCFPTGAQGALWEMFPAEKYVFVIYDSKTVYTYIYVRESVNGKNIFLYSSTRAQKGITQILFLFCVYSGKNKY